MIDFIWNLFSFLIALGILVAVHEWGHFYVARLCGVKVLRFSIGFGKIIWSRTDKHGTEFALAAIPLGGYVKMLDTRVDSVPTEQLNQTFDHKSIAQRMAIVVAGPMVNFLFAIVALAVMFMIGVTTLKPVIGDLVPDSIAERANLPIGAEIVSINQHPTRDWEKVNYELVAALGDDSLNITTQSNARKITQTVNLDGWQLPELDVLPITAFGLNIDRPKALNVIREVVADSAAEQAGLRVDDKILAIDGTNVEQWEQTVAYVQARPGQKVALQVERGFQRVTLDVVLGVREVQGKQIGLLGAAPQFERDPDEYFTTIQHGPVGAISQGAKQTWRLMTLSLELLTKLFTGDLGLDTLSGPVGIAQGAGANASYGLVYFLGFLALISVNLGIINLLPLPMLDGGHLLFYSIEWVRGKAVSEATQEMSLRIGAAFIFSVMSIAIFNDIMRLV